MGHGRAVAVRLPVNYDGARCFAAAISTITANVFYGTVKAVGALCGLCPCLRPLRTYYVPPTPVILDVGLYASKAAMALGFCAKSPERPSLVTMSAMAMEALD